MVTTPMGNAWIIQQIFRHCSDSMKDFVPVVRSVDENLDIVELDSFYGKVFRKKNKEERDFGWEEERGGRGVVYSSSCFFCRLQVAKYRVRLTDKEQQSTYRNPDSLYRDSPRLAK